MAGFVLALVGVVVVLLPSLGYRLLFVDPLAAPVEPGGRWVLRGRRGGSTRSPQSPDHAVRRLPWALRFRRALAGPLAVVLVAGVVLLTAWKVAETRYEVPAAYADAAWWPEYRATTKWILDRGFNGLDEPPFRDVRSRHINITDGVRRSWTPPECSCRRIRIAMFGGSTTFGMGQRDEHTIASELAKVAWEHGYALDVENRGVPADIHWSEARRFAWRASGTDRPDLAIFYDGVNDLGAEARSDDGSGQPVDTPVRDVDEASRRYRSLLATLFGTRPPPGARFVDAEPGPNDRSAAEVGRAAVRRYERARLLSRAVATESGIPVRWFWQPAKSDRGHVAGEPENEGFDWSVELREAARRALPDEVIDLSDALDEVEGPVFYDDSHHNEVGARAIAERMYEALADDIRRLGSN